MLNFQISFSLSISWESEWDYWFFNCVDVKTLANMSFVLTLPPEKNFKLFPTKSNKYAFMSDLEYRRNSENRDHQQWEVRQLVQFNNSARKFKLCQQLFLILFIEIITLDIKYCFPWKCISTFSFHCLSLSIVLQFFLCLVFILIVSFREQ